MILTQTYLRTWLICIPLVLEYILLWIWFREYVSRIRWKDESIFSKMSLLRIGKIDLSGLNRWLIACWLTPIHFLMHIEDLNKFNNAPKTIQQWGRLQRGLKDTWSMIHSKYVTHYSPQSCFPYTLTTPHRIWHE